MILFPKPVIAEKIAGNSALLTSVSIDNTQSLANFKQKIAIRKVLQKWQSPLVDSVDDFITACNKYNLDCYLLPSITGIESSFGKHIYPNSNNPFGWGRGLIMFEDWAEAIDTVGKGLRENYYNKGAETIEDVGRIYCEGNTWAGKVRFFMNEFKKEEDKIQLFST